MINNTNTNKMWNKFITDSSLSETVYDYEKEREREKKNSHAY